MDTNPRAADQAARGLLGLTDDGFSKNPHR
jgi:hypothetical protein